MDGVLIIDKPEEWTSHDVIARLRRILKTKRIGHTGTLDPFATGVLVVMVGKATRLARFLDRDEKEYEAVIRFGFVTDTGDKTGTKKEENSTNNELISELLDKVEWENIFQRFRGVIEQTPPMYSAKKVKGKKLYEMARKGIEIEREAVKVKISKLELINDTNNKTADQRSIKVSCSAGTYIRTLAEDIGKKIGIGAHLAELRRIRAGKFSVENAVKLEDLAKMAENEDVAKILIPLNESISHLPKVVMEEFEVKKIINGMKIFREETEFEDLQAIRMTDEKNNLIAVGFYTNADKMIQPRVVVV